MIRAFEEEMDKLRTRIIKMGSLVDEQVEYAFRALNEWNTAMAHLVMDRDSKVDKLDFKIEKQCQRIFALQQPVARDLRLIMAALKINSDLERMGDLAFNVARSVEALMPYKHFVERLEIAQMTDAVHTMVGHTIDSFVNNDPEMALTIMRSDIRVDQYEQRIGRQIVEMMKREPEFIEAGALLIVQLRNMERLADHATNIAEDVIFFTEAKIIRNRFDADAFKNMDPHPFNETEDDNEKDDA
ncbi:MAG TPA: phosphate signaling complex protein PhoU [Candidatus Kapabacteria bacterium]|nr:phosphate signaling complex protein PhoU [Candidatus Kapabacteria bacterium]